MTSLASFPLVVTEIEITPKRAVNWNICSTNIKSILRSKGTLCVHQTFYSTHLWGSSTAMFAGSWSGKSRRVDNTSKVVIGVDVNMAEHYLNKRYHNVVETNRHE